MAAKKAAKKTAKKAAVKIAKKGAPQKKPESYLIPSSGVVLTMADYLQSPATAFLKQAAEAYYGVGYLQRNAPKAGKSAAKPTAAAERNLQLMTGALFAGVMGRFETFQKCLFAGLFEASRLLKEWDAEVQAARIGRDLTISPVRLAAHRGQATNVGLVVADAISGWHNPKEVARLFKAFDDGIVFYDEETQTDLKVLWQLRHALVHTGGWLTSPDAQKVSRLVAYGNSALAFDDQFMNGFCRLIHRVVARAVTSVEKRLRPRLLSGLKPAEVAEFDLLVKVDSPIKQFLK